MNARLGVSSRRNASAERAPRRRRRRAPPNQSRRRPQRRKRRRVTRIRLFPWYPGRITTEPFDRLRVERERAILEATHGVDDQIRSRIERHSRYWSDRVTTGGSNLCSRDLSAGRSAAASLGLARFVNGRESSASTTSTAGAAAVWRTVRRPCPAEARWCRSRTVSVSECRPP